MTDQKILRCEDCGWTGKEEGCGNLYNLLSRTSQLACPECVSTRLIRLEKKEATGYVKPPQRLDNLMGIDPNKDVFRSPRGYGV